MSSRLLTLLVASALFVGSGLLFLLEPMFGRVVLPLLGGAPAGWTTCLLFFQFTLLVGYAYAWASARWLAPRTQVVVHGVLLLAAIVALPIGVPQRWAAPNEASPVAWLLGLLSVSIGLPFLAVATTAPVLQHWFSTSEHPESGDPYFLYQASNLGSIAALLAYPMAVEPWLGVRTQAAGWAWVYGGFLALVGACAFATHLHRRPGVASRAADPGDRTPMPSWQRQVRWVALSAVPSSLLLGVTSYITTDIAAVPLLWVVPLVIYLLTFVITFARRPILSRSAMLLALPILVLPQVATFMLDAASPPWLIIPLHLLGFAGLACVCHRELADDRPAPSHLTLFYLWLAVGGTLGGLFNAVVAPQLFSTTLEYPVAIVAACLLIPSRRPAGPGGLRWGDLVFPVLLGGAAAGLFVAVPRLPGGDASWVPIATTAGLALVCLSFSSRALRFGVGVAALLVSSVVRPSGFGNVERVERSFFGIHRVAIDANRHIRELYHGTTLHGAQSTDPLQECEPLTYYSRQGPIGQLFESFGSRQPGAVAVVGLGTGSLSCYRRPGQSWTFFEIDNVIVRLSGDRGPFSFLRACGAPVQIVLGDARWSLAHSRAPVFDLLVIDAFSSDAIPIHLLTREALRVYLSRLSPEGVIAFHVSNRFMKLERPVADLANDAGLAHLWNAESDLTADDEQQGRAESDWIVLARQAGTLARIATYPGWQAVPGAPARVWTDDYVNTLSVLHWN
jgi:hypothetical protein